MSILRNILMLVMWFSTLCSSQGIELEAKIRESFLELRERDLEGKEPIYSQENIRSYVLNEAIELRKKLSGDIIDALLYKEKYVNRWGAMLEFAIESDRNKTILQTEAIFKETFSYREEQAGVDGLDSTLGCLIRYMKGDSELNGTQKSLILIEILKQYEWKYTVRVSSLLYKNGYVDFLPTFYQECPLKEKRRVIADIIKRLGISYEKRRLEDEDLRVGLIKSLRDRIMAINGILMKVKDNGDKESIRMICEGVEESIESICYFEVELEKDFSAAVLKTISNISLELGDSEVKRIKLEIPERRERAIKKLQSLRNKSLHPKKGLRDKSPHPK